MTEMDEEMRVELQGARLMREAAKAAIDNAHAQYGAWRDSTTQVIREAASRGASDSAIARELGMDRKAVADLRRNGVVASKPRGRPRKPLAE